MSVGLVLELPESKRKEVEVGFRLKIVSVLVQTRLVPLQRSRHFTLVVRGWYLGKGSGKL